MSAISDPSLAPGIPCEAEQEASRLVLVLLEQLLALLLALYGIVLVVLVAQSIEAAAPQHRQSDTYQYDAMPCHAMACYAMISNETYESMDCSRTFPAHRTYATDPRISKTLSVQGGVGTLLFLVENRPRRAWSVSVLQWHTN